MESALEQGEPRLRSMFAIFTRLNRDEGAPRTEALRPETLLRRLQLAGVLTTGRARAMLGFAIITGLVTLFVFTALSGSSTKGCRTGPVLNRTVSCQQAQESQGRP